MTGPALRAIVVIDYQNVHLCARDHFLPGTAAADSLISPGRFARRLIEVRNRMSPLPAELVEAVVFRGLPEPQFDLYGYQRNLAHQRSWEADPAVRMVHQPLRYRVLRAAYSVGPAGAQVQPEVDVTEKGVDVLCALEVVDAASRRDVDLVVLASHDHDLDPAVAAVQRSRSARVEGFQWFGGPGQQVGHLHGDSQVARLWCTRMDVDDFAACRDEHDYLIERVGHGSREGQS
ncbi:hypothetical protein A5768_26000 [Mycolicibacterium fortuitum]|uniref:NYN domain-containing protein n=1 Tax=Mycolicibacterium fortuitum TaxID=1766 RepID=UPI0007EAE32A|nr:NYN domain-containing protein [Mycolicibacterium fortuitum]OBG21561.1 hypothetical protein A5768_26000 [Mycolicibacterium fortuitum]